MKNNRTAVAGTEWAEESMHRWGQGNSREWDHIKLFSTCKALTYAVSERRSYQRFLSRAIR
jgi:hypothetical protein